MSKRAGMRVSLRIHPAGGLTLAALFLLSPSPVALAAVMALALHEGAHLLAFWLCGLRRCTLELTPFGGVADAPGYESLPGWKRGAAAGAGVLGSGLAAALCALHPADRLIEALLKMNVTLALLNCLPVWPLDGARMLLALAGRFRLERAAAKSMLALSYGLSLALTALGLYSAWLGQINLSLLALGPYLAYAARESAVGSRIRGLERAARTRRLEAGEIVPARAYLSLGMPERLALTRLWARAPEGRACLMLIQNPETGALERVLSERELAEMLFDDAL